MKNLFGETPVRILAFGALLLALVFAFFTIRILLVPFVAALFVAYLFDPVIMIFQRRGIDRGKAFLVLLFLSLAAIVVFLTFMPAWLKLESVGGSSQTFAGRLTMQVNVIERWINLKFPFL